MSATTDRPEESRFLATLRRNFWIPILTLVIAGGVAYFITQRAPDKYSAYSLISIDAPDLNALIAGSGQANQDPDVKAASNVVLVSQRSVAAQTGRKLKPKATTDDVVSAISAEREGTTSYTRVTATASSPKRAADIANVYVDTFVRQQRAQQQARLDSARKSLQLRYRSLAEEARIGGTGQAIATSLSRVEGLSDLPRTSFRVVAGATPPGESSTAPPYRNTAAGALLGLLLGLGLVALRDAGDKRVRRSEDLEHTFETSLLASIPRSRALRRRTDFGELPIQVREPYRLLDIQLQSELEADGPQAVVVTSAIGSEGKTTTAWYMAAAAAARGQKVLLVEADFRKPVMRERFDLDSSAGVLGLLEHQPLESAVERVEDATGGFDVLAGPQKGNEASLSAPLSLPGHLPELLKTYDFVILDVAPLTVVADGIPLAKRSAGVVIVSTPGLVNRPTARKFREQLERNGIRVLGVVGNGYTADVDFRYA